MPSRNHAAPMTDICDRRDETALRHQIVNKDVILELVNYICVCAAVPEGKSNIVEVRLDVARDVKQLCEILLYHPSSTIVIPGSEVFVCCLQALMVLELIDKRSLVEIFLVDPDAKLPPNWSYRFPWRKLAVDHDGLTVAQVGAYAQKFKTLCEIELNEPGVAMDEQDLEQEGREEI